MNYSSLVTQIQNYANKSDTDFIDSIQCFIQMGQQRIWRELTGIEFEETIFTKTLEKGNAYLPKPLDWNKTISFYYGTTDNFSYNYNILKLRTFEFCRTYWPNSSIIDFDNPPEFYADAYTDGFGRKGNYFFISPTPDEYYFYQLTYLRRINPIDTINSSNILTRDYPDLLFYACFLEALAYLRDDERIQIYEANYQRALESARAKTADRHMDRTTNREID